MNETDELKARFARAAEIASAVPESMQEAAFHRALDALEAEPEPGNSPPRPKKIKRKQATTAERSSPSAAPPVDVVGLFNALPRDRAHAVDAETIGRDKAMALLRIAHDEFDVDGLTASAIATVLTEKFRVRVTRQAIGQALNGAGRMVDRVKEGRTVRFRLMAEGEAWLDTAPAERESARPTGRRTSKSTTASSKKSATKNGKASTKPASSDPKNDQKGTSSKSSNGKPRRNGPKAAVEELIASGYFSKPRTIGDIQTTLEDQTARKFKPSDLSPTMVRILRENVLTRSKNSDGQYEYVTPGA